MINQFNRFNKTISFIIFSFWSLCNCQSTKEKSNINIYHGVEILDNYKNLEDLEDKNVLSWLIKQNKNTRLTLDKIKGRSKLVSIQESLSNDSLDEITSVKVSNNDKVFYLRRKSTEDYPKLFYRVGIYGKEYLLFDPKKEHSDSSYINYFNPNIEGSMLAIGIGEKGKESSLIRIVNVLENRVHPILIKSALTKFGGVHWLPDSSGIIYLESNIDKSSKEVYRNSRSMLRKLNSKVSKVIFSKKNNPQIEIKSNDVPGVYNYNYDKDYLYGVLAGSNRNQDQFYSPVSGLKKDKLVWNPLFKKEDKVASFYRKDDTIFYLTSKNASNFKICSKSLSNNQTPKLIIKEKEDEVISSFRLIKDGLVYVTTKNGVQAKIYLLNNYGETEELISPFAAGKIVLTTKGPNNNYLSILAEGWANKKRDYTYNFSKKIFEAYDLQEHITGNLIKDIKIEEITIPSHDGEAVPLSLIYHDKLKKEGSNPTLMVAYGAFGTSIKPKFSKKVMTWIKEGGIFAVAHVRGGGEKGDAWYKAGRKETKPNTWKDVIACAQFLIKNKYTSSNEIVLNGASAGGIAVGRAITERPDLFKAAIIDAGNLNAIREEAGSNGEFYTKEYGSVKDSIGFHSILKMDAYQHIKKGIVYPAVLLTIGMNDTRVPPWHSAKFAAKLMDYNNSAFLSVDFNSGHGFDTSKNKKTEKITDVLGFAFWQTGHPDYQAKK